MPTAVRIGVNGAGSAGHIDPSRQPAPADGQTAQPQAVR